MSAHRILSGLLLGAVIISVNSPVSACGGAGENVHIGPVVSVDSQQQTFTIRDAEQGTLVKFSAAPELLLTLRLDPRPVAVTYESVDSTLIARSVR